MDQVDHFSHHHPLIRCDTINNTKDGEEVICYGCEIPIKEITSSSSYGCKDCNVFLCKSCVELPTECQSPCHPTHPLTLLFSESKHFCKICCPPIAGFAYGCAECSFYAHIRCHSFASSPDIAARKLEDGGHLFFLRETEPRTGYPCDLCDDLGNAMDTYLFQCLIPACPRIMHFRCTPLPLPETVKHPWHYHELTLTERFVEEEGLEEYYCDSCEMERDPRHSVYVCRECGYAAHVTCVVFEMLPSIIAEYEKGAKAKGISANDVTLGNLNAKIQENHYEQGHLRHELEQIAAKIKKLEEVRAQYLASKIEATTLS